MVYGWHEAMVKGGAFANLPRAESRKTSEPFPRYSPMRANDLRVLVLARSFSIIA
jgi:hypothetical protein